MTKRITKSVLSIVALALTVQAYAAHLGDQVLLSARLNGAQEVPAVATTAVGVAAFALNATRDTLCMNITVNGLTGPITGAHVHAGATGVNGPVIFAFTANFVGTSATATIAGTDLTPALLSDYLRGMMYVNVHTTANPGGEIRGQIIQETDMQFVADLNGTQEVPPVPTGAFGLATFALSKHNAKLTLQVVADGLSGTINSAHFHTGAPGVSGPVAIDLTSFISGNTIIAAIDPTPILADLMAGNIYINLHTTANPGGEIRGQLTYDDRLAFDALINGAQEVPPVPGTGTAVANVKLNTTFDTLTYDIVANGLSGPINSAHFHNAEQGISGPVVHDISAGINGNRITGSATGAALTSTFLGDLFKGNLYLNLHTTTWPSGEIRGQVYRLLREGYSGVIEGAQENPPVTSIARGTVVVSVDRNQTDLHFMAVVDNITLTTSHFHNAPQGQNGGVIYDLTSQFIDNGVFGYWLSTDATPFTLASSLLFRNDSVYINVHTTANPGGEIRGQVERGFHCFSIPTGINDNTPQVADFTAYPTPADKQLNVTFTGYIGKEAEIIIIDLQGRRVSSHGFNTSGDNTKVTMDVSALNAGTYLLQLNIEGKPAAHSKFVKQ